VVVCGLSSPTGGEKHPPLYFFFLIRGGGGGGWRRNGGETALGRLGGGFLCNFSSRVSTSGGY